MSYHMLDVVTSLSGCVHKPNMYEKPRAFSSTFSSRSSSVNKEISSSSSSAFTSSNTVGVLGGISTITTLNFIEKLVKCSPQSLPFIACNDTVLNKELSSSQRNSSAYDSRNKHWQFNKSLIVDNLKQKRLFLEKSGARCIAMPCHLSNVWFEEVSEGCSVPFFHVGECAAKELKDANLKPLEAGSNVRIAVLASESILAAGSYQKQLQNQGFEVVLPDRATIEHTVNPAIKAFERKDMEGARNLLRIALQVLLVRAVNKVIIASDEMIGLLPEDDPLLSKCTNPVDALVRSTVQWAVLKEDRRN